MTTAISTLFHKHNVNNNQFLHSTGQWLGSTTSLSFKTLTDLISPIHILINCKSSGFISCVQLCDPRNTFEKYVVSLLMQSYEIFLNTFVEGIFSTSRKKIIRTIVCEDGFLKKKYFW